MTVNSWPAVRPVPAADVRAALAGARRVVFLDDDPTGTQTVRDLPVLTRWAVDDVRWALRQGTAGFFVLTNTRSLAPQDAAARDREVVEACLTAAERDGIRLAFASRSDSTLRGHFPLETDVIGELLAEHGGAMDGVVLAPAFTDAGRVTIGGVHYLRSGDELLPVADSEFARDATFGFAASRLADWVAEKSGGRIPASEVVELTLRDLRGGSTDSLRDRLTGLSGGRVVVLDTAEDDDLRAGVLAILAAEDAGKSLVYRVGPSFVRARTGQDTPPPIEDDALAALVGRDAHGLVVVGSHVGLTSRQLTKLGERREFVHVELDVPAILEHPAEHIDAAATRAAAALERSLVVLSTSRTLVTGADETESLDIARRVSAALTETARRAVARRRPAFVVGKGGITSSDVATGSLGIRRAWVRGSMLPGIVSLWEPVSGPAQGLPYVVFAGNVGDENSLADVVDRLEAV
ncbi:four-carbon acid sugar kinase family protein [Amycolatopsis thermophila]|uniref:Uncharacterized protein YgbK (DUF1537 family) n=1 Tax=Amycolatopsis thermophila TaxID=206084 RepID=A0ABU0F113_9PSEU|nr:four-carbon acid sugar kinase family protein [Amycolatopsis thermophila]MDQ0381193.1 uncharacterized protein YgbK (DUF1537 family) [Amycolatopsis thermophila]